MIDEFGARTVDLGTLSIGLEDVYVAITAWEQAELVNAPIARAPNLRAFKTFPTADDLEAPNGDTLTLPFTSHWGLDTKWLLGSVRSGDGYVEDQDTHTFGCGLFFGMENDAWDVLSLKDARWRKWYRLYFLRHLQLGIVAAGLAHSVTMEMLNTVAFGRNLFNVNYAGIMTVCTATIRQAKVTGLG